MFITHTTVLSIHLNDVTNLNTTECRNIANSCHPLSRNIQVEMMIFHFQLTSSREVVFSA